MKGKHRSLKEEERKMAWDATWEGPLTSYLKQFAGLIGDQRTRKTFGETVKGIIGASSLICQRIAAQSDSCASNWGKDV